ncbi:MAG: hypothetical protein KGL39_58690 [Patescibacteria group bacterium]|nr:hypothetical protein [Patescibacteria group bacterium]
MTKATAKPQAPDPPPRRAENGWGEFSRPVRIGKREIAALRDIAAYPGTYWWKPASMAKLAVHQLVARVGTVPDGGYRITGAGIAFLAHLPRDSAA